MKKFSALNLLDRMKPGWFFFFLFVYQLFFTFQGFELSDEGLYATSYYQIFRNPETVQYNFMFWFSAIIGGAWTWLFPDLGLWGIRLAGVLVTTSTVIVTYYLLRKYLRPAHLKLGLLLVILLINNNLKLVHYNDLSALFNMLTIVFLFAGLKEENHWKLLIAGAFVAISSFTRLPNVLNLWMVIGIFYYGYHINNSFKQQLLQSFSYVGGFMLMSAGMLLFMNAIGHLPIFVNAVKLVSEMGSGGDDSYYGPMVLVKNFISTYALTMKITLFAVVVIAVLSILHNLWKNSDYYSRGLAVLLKIAIVAAICYLIVQGEINNFTLLHLLTGISILSTILMLFTNTNLETKLLALLGCFILLSYPFTSSAGLYTVGIYSLWLSLPLALDFIFKINTIKGQLSMFRTDAADTANTVISRQQLHDIRRWTIVIFIFGCLFYSYRYPFFDKQERLEMTATINSPNVKWIHTTPARAALTNQMLAVLGNHVKKDDFLLAYQTIPLVNYITETKPYVRSSYPWLYEANVFKSELTRAINTTRVLPVVVRQKVKFTGFSSNWPSKEMYAQGWDESNVKRDTYMNEFLSNHGYSEVWSNEAFMILVPPTREVD